MNEINEKASVSSPTTQQSEVIAESDVFLSEAVLNDDALQEYHWRQYVDKCLVEAEAELKADVPTIPADVVMKEMKQKYFDGQP